MKHPVNIAHHKDRTYGERAADKLAAFVGSWRFVIGQNVMVLLWMVANSIGLYGISRYHWDVYPFLLLNIVFSWQASNAGPILQMTQNRQSQKDRMTLEHSASLQDVNDKRMSIIMRAQITLLRCAPEETTELENELSAHLEEMQDESGTLSLL